MKLNLLFDSKYDSLLLSSLKCTSGAGSCVFHNEGVDLTVWKTFLCINSKVVIYSIYICLQPTFSR